MQTLLITVDTNLVDPETLTPVEALLADIPHEIAYVSVTEREHGYEIGYLGHRITETGVWGESEWGDSNWGGPMSAQFVIGESTFAPDDATPGRYDVLSDGSDVFERTLAIIGDGSFPKPGDRDNLSVGERRQLRDAMIFEAHVRARRHVLVSNDERAYVDHGKRDKLGALGRTEIRTLDEFVAMVADGTVGDLLPPA